MLQRSLSRKFAVNWKKILIILIFGLFFFGGLWIFEENFKIKKVEIVSEEKTVTVNGINNLLNKNIFIIQENNLEKILLELNPGFDKIKVKKTYPDKLILSVELARPIAAVKTNDGFFILSEKGQIVAKKKEIEQKLTLINYYQKFDYSSYHLGDSLNFKDIIYGLFFLKKATEVEINIDTIDIGGFNMIGLNSEERKYLFTTEKPISIQKNNFLTIIKRLKIEGKNYKTLDLRFDKPIIEFYN